MPEYGREYTVEKCTIGSGGQWLPSDFLCIALEQNALEDRMAVRRPWASCSATPTASRRAVTGRVPRSTSDAVWRAAAAHGAPYVLYVVTDHVGIPWEVDGYRLGDETRARTTGRFEQVLTERRLPWTKATGSRSVRLAQVVAALDHATTDGWRNDDV